MLTYYEIISNLTSIKPKKILEIGSRDGDDAKILASLFSVEDHNVTVIEPHPQSFRNICVKYPEFDLYNVALSDKNEQMNFFALKAWDGVNYGASSLLPRNDSFYDETPKDIVIVECLTGKTFFEINNKNEDIYDLCKIDVEGLSLEVLRGFSEKLSNIKSIHIECETKKIWKDQHLYDEVCKYLLQNDYIKLYEVYINENTQTDSIWAHKNTVKKI